MKLLIVIVSYKVTHLTVDCLRSLSTEIDSVPGAKVAVCENGTGEAAVQQLRAAIETQGWQDWVSLTDIYPNRGFTGGNNVILEEAMARPQTPEYFLLLNADTIVRPHALRELMDFMDTNPDVGIAGSRLEDPDGSAQVSAFRFHNVLNEFDRGLRLNIVSKLLGRWQVNLPIPDRPSPADWVSGASMIVRRRVFQDVGLLDEAYYTYFDDIDLCFTAQRAGWPTWYVPQSRVVHFGGQTTGIHPEGEKGRRPRYWFEARRRYFLKNHGRIYAALADGAFILGLALWRLRRIIQGKPDTDPEKMLPDAVRNSVFLTGFKRKPVRNPAM